MENKEIEEGNDLISSFMGLREEDAPEVITNHHVWHTYPIGSGGCVTSQLQYHSSWDWLMPVVEKISESKHVIIQVGICRIQMVFGDAWIYKKASNLDSFQEVPPIVEHNEHGFIGNVWHACVDYIQWYNQQTPSITQ